MDELKTAANGGPAKKSDNVFIIPPFLKTVPRWILRNKVKKPVRRNGTRFVGIKWSDPQNWRPFDEVASVKPPAGGGLGFIFTDDDNLGGVDLDGCRDPETGELTEWAHEIIDRFGSFAEVSPSGTGVKIYAKGAPKKLPKNRVAMDGGFGGKTPQVEVFVSGRYFAVTGAHLPGTPEDVKDVPDAWAWLVKKHLGGNKEEKKPEPTVTKETTVGEGQRNNRATTLAGTMHRKGMEPRAILAALEMENRLRFDPPLEDDELKAVVKSITKKEHEFAKDKNEKILTRSQENVRLALEKLNVRISYDTFADRFLIQRGEGAASLLDDAAFASLWLEIDTAFGFQPAEAFFRTVVMDAARRNTFHPVRDYLNGLEWDGTERLDRWLVDYADAKDSPYTRAVGALVLVAAVRRVRRAAVKFDELLVLESAQGTNKSSALSALCPNPSWFTDDLPLNVDSKQVIERTTGRWIVEASELSGLRKDDIEQLKSFLSRGVDVARLAYGRSPTERERHFIVVGTTNSSAYLRDSTGNRRFWPVAVEGFDLERLRVDRDQLWAEAAAREAAGASIRLDPSLYAAAAGEQEQRRVVDPWEASIAEAVDEREGRISADAVWSLLGVAAARRTQHENARLGEAMRRLGFERTRFREMGTLVYGYKRGGSDQVIEVWSEI